MKIDASGLPRSRFLENRFPPPLVFLVVGLLMLLVSRLGPVMAIAPRWRLAVAQVLWIISPVIAGQAMYTFWKVRTTINPVRLEDASSLVTGGVFRLTRNPMYVALASLLTGWALYLGAVWALAGPLFFVLFTTRFQIIPEERVMKAKFGRDYEDYQKRVRRWI